MKIPTLYGKAIKGKLDFGVRLNKRLEEYLLNFEKKEFSVIIEKVTSKRSEQQNAYYFGVIVPLCAKEFGISDSETHEILKMEFNKKTVTYKDTITYKDSVGSQKMTTVARSTSNLTLSSFGEYIERIRAYMALNYNLDIPDPVKIEVEIDPQGDYKEITAF
jgi:hypothetical protein